ncbi:MAG: T9SS type A sorting domain-containing protein [Saprospiraceae bacterium]|nr:T9SS type A sorting domain-containing protein [Saprospiraceae bacterium]
MAYLTGEQIEPQINYTVVPRIRTEKTEQIREEIQILPNPAKDYLSISIKNLRNESQYSYELYTITGQKVMQGQLKDQNELNISILAQGLYFISINKDGLKFKSQK